MGKLLAELFIVVIEIIIVALIENKEKK